MKRVAVAAAALIALAGTAGLVVHQVASTARAHAVSVLGGRVDSLVARFEAAATTHTYAREEAALLRDWCELERQFTRLDRRARQGNAYERRIGELYVLGYRMDVADTWEKAESHLKRAIELAPEDDGARLDLARHYVDSDLALAGEAERLLRIVRHRGSERQRKIALRSLVFAYQYQGECSQAFAAADSATREIPAQRDLAGLRDLFAQAGCGPASRDPSNHRDDLSARAARPRTARDSMMARVDARRWVPLYVQDSAALRYDRTRVLRLWPGDLRLWVRLDFIAPTRSIAGDMHNAELAEWQVDCGRKWMRFAVVAQYFNDKTVWRADDPSVETQPWLQRGPGGDSQDMLRPACKLFPN